MFGWKQNTVKKNTEISVVGRKETGIEANTEKTKYMVRSRDQNAGQNDNIKMGSIPFERVEWFKYLGKT
jgi:hypothetical protein